MCMYVCMYVCIYVYIYIYIYYIGCLVEDNDDPWSQSTTFEFKPRILNSNSINVLLVLSQLNLIIDKRITNQNYVPT